MGSRGHAGAGRGPERILYWAAVASSFAALAVLNGRGIDSRAGFVTVYALCMIAFALLALAGLGGLVYVLNPFARERHGFYAILNAFARGFVALVSFALLALFAELLLGWNAALAFTQAGIMSCGALAGTEVVKLSDGRMVHIIAPVAGVFLFSFFWILLSAAAQALAG